jgi:hypothetical protein
MIPSAGPAKDDAHPNNQSMAIGPNNPAEQGAQSAVPPELQQVPLRDSRGRTVQSVSSGAGTLPAATREDRQSVHLQGPPTDAAPVNGAGKTHGKTLGNAEQRAGGEPKRKRPADEEAEQEEMADQEMADPPKAKGKEPVALPATVAVICGDKKGELSTERIRIVAEGAPFINPSR